MGFYGKINDLNSKVFHIDKTYSSYSALQQGVANGEVYYGRFASVAPDAVDGNENKVYQVNEDDTVTWVGTLAAIIKAGSLDYFEDGFTVNSRPSNPSEPLADVNINSSGELDVTIKKIGLLARDIYDLLYGTTRKTEIGWTGSGNRNSLITEDSSTITFSADEISTVSGAINTVQEMLGRDRITTISSLSNIVEDKICLYNNKAYVKTLDGNKEITGNLLNIFGALTEVYKLIGTGEKVDGNYNSNTLKGLMNTLNGIIDSNKQLKAVKVMAGTGISVVEPVSGASTNTYTVSHATISTTTSTSTTTFTISNSTQTVTFTVPVQTISNGHVTNTLDKKIIFNMSDIYTKLGTKANESTVSSSLTTMNTTIAEKAVEATVSASLATMNTTISLKADTSTVSNLTTSVSTLYDKLKDKSGINIVQISGTIPTLTNTNSVKVAVQGVKSDDEPLLKMNESTYDSDKEEVWSQIYKATTTTNNITFYFKEAITTSVTVAFTGRIIRVGEAI